MSHTADVPSLLWLLPFVAMLAGLAVLPLAVPHRWESNLGKAAFSACLGLPVVGLYLLRAPGVLLHEGGNYLSFIVMLASLFVIAGGVLVEGDLEARPLVNAGILAAGAVLASVVGTTGASMLLIRPLLQTNSERRHVTHTLVFFIFLVANIGGALTPLGDPPLFLGYLSGVPFTWPLRLLPHWALTCGLLLVIYVVWDTRTYARESVATRLRDRADTEPLRVRGVGNLALLAGAVGAAALLPAPWRELTLVGLTAVSWWSTSLQVRQANQFSWHPIVEVAVVFAGVFATMLPALDIVRAHGHLLGVREPWQFFWATGLLSAFLDNAPTYMTFLALGQGLQLSPEVVGVSHRVLEAISAGAVFMGAGTYIGNGPNFMVRSIAEARGVRMPGFFGYLAYSGAVLVPVLLVVTVVFFW